MRVLAVAQSPAEVEWAVSEARQEPRQTWTVLLLGDSAALDRSESACTMLTLSATGFNPEDAWRDCRALQEELWRDVGNQGVPTLALAGQWFVADRLLNLLIAENALAAAIRVCRPRRIRIPPPFTHRGLPPPLALPYLYELVGQTASRHGVDFRLPWLYRLFNALESLRTMIIRLFIYVSAVKRDLSALAGWAIRRSPRQNLSSAACLVFCNSHTDLERQFKLRLPDSYLSRSLSWDHNTARLGPFAAGPGAAPRRGGGARELIDALLPPPPGGRRPTLVTPMLFSPAIPWFCAQSGERPKRVSQRLHALLGATAFAGTRLLDFRRYVNSIRTFAQISDVIQATQPSLLVTGDTFFLDRAATLAARARGVRTLSTSHAIQMFSENFFEFYNLAHSHAVFHRMSTIVGGADHPLFPGRRAVFHDALPPPGQLPPSNGGRRIVIFTSAWNFRGGWANEALINQSVHDSGLQELVRVLLDSHPATRILLKPHPTGEPHVIHRQVASSHPARVTLSHDPLPQNGALEADLAVFYNCVSTAFFQVASQGIPVICHRGAMTPLARRLFGTSALLGADDARAMARLASEILDSPTGRMAEAAQAAATKVWDAYIQPSQGGLAAALKAAMTV